MAATEALAATVVPVVAAEAMAAAARWRRVGGGWQR